METIRLNMPLSYKIANAIGNLFVAARLPSMRFDEKSVYTAAIKQTGLMDFGDSYYRQGLLLLLKSAEKDTCFHPIGRLTAHNIITAYLAKRLRLIETRKRNPEIFEKPLQPPLIITGMARSGTTFLHKMLTLNPVYHGLPLWLLMRPFPEKTDGKDDSRDPRIVEAEKIFRFQRPLLPQMDAIHYYRPDSPEECMLALGLTFESLLYYTLFPVHGYMDWYLQQEEAPQKYREYSWLLKVFNLMNQSSGLR